MSELHNAIKDFLRALDRCPLVVPASAANSGRGGMPSNAKPQENKTSGKDSIASQKSSTAGNYSPSNSTSQKSSTAGNYSPPSNSSSGSSSSSSSSSSKKKSSSSSSSSSKSGGGYTADEERKKAEEAARKKREEEERQARIKEQQQKQAEAQRQAADKQAQIALQAMRDAAEQQRIANEKAQAAAKATPNATVTINGQTIAAGGKDIAQQEMKKAGVIKSDKGGMYEAQTAMANAATAKRVAAGEVAAASTFLGNAVNAEKNALSGYSEYNISKYSTSHNGASGVLIAEQEMKKAGALNVASISEKQAFVNAVQRIYNRYGEGIQKGNASDVKAAEEAVLRAEHIILKGKSWDLYKDKESVADYASARNLKTADDLRTAKALFDAQNLKQFKEDPLYARDRAIVDGKVVWTGAYSKQQAINDALMADGAHSLVPKFITNFFDSYTRKIDVERALAPQVGKALGLSDADVHKIMARDIYNDDFETLMAACIAHECTPDQFLQNKAWFASHPGGTFKEMAHTTVRLANTADIADLQRDNSPYVQIFLENSSRWKYTAADKNMYVGNQMLNTSYTGLAYYNTETGEIIRVARDSDKPQAYKNTESKMQACLAIADFNANKYVAAANKIDRITKGYGLVASAISYLLKTAEDPEAALKEYVMASKMYDAHAAELDDLVVEVNEAFNKYLDYEYRAGKYQTSLNTNIVYADKAYEEKMDDLYAQSQLACAESRNSEKALSFGNRDEVNSFIDVLGVAAQETKKILTNVGSQNLTAFIGNIVDPKPGPYDQMINSYFTNICSAATQWWDNSAIIGGIPTMIEQMNKDKELRVAGIDRAVNTWQYFLGFVATPMMREMAEWGDTLMNAVGIKTRIVSYNAYLHRYALQDNEYSQYLTGELGNLDDVTFKQIYDATYKYMNGTDTGIRATVDYSDTCYAGQLSKGMGLVTDLIVDLMCDPQTYLGGGLLQLMGVEGVKGGARKAVVNTAGERLRRAIIEDTLAAGKKLDYKYIDEIVDTFKKAALHNKSTVSDMFSEANEGVAKALSTHKLVETLENTGANSLKEAKKLTITESGAAAQHVMNTLDSVERALKNGEGLVGKEKLLYNAAATTVNVLEMADKIDSIGIILAAWPVAGAAKALKLVTYASQWIRVMSPKLVKLGAQQGSLALSRLISKTVTVLSGADEAEKLIEEVTDAASTEMKALTSVDPKGAAGFLDCVRETIGTYKTQKAVNGVTNIMEAEKRALSLYDDSDLGQHALKMQALSDVHNKMQRALDMCELSINTVSRDADRMKFIKLRREVQEFMAQADKELCTDMLNVFKQLDTGLKNMRDAFDNEHFAKYIFEREQITGLVREAQHNAQALHQVLGSHNINYGVQEFVDVIDDFSNLADEFAHVYNPIMIDEVEVVAHYLLALEETSDAIDDITRQLNASLTDALDILNSAKPTIDGFRNHPLYTTPVMSKELNKADVAERLTQKVIDAKGDSGKGIRGLEGRINSSLKTSMSEVNFRDAENVYMFDNTPQGTVKTFLNSYEAEEIMDAMHGYGALANNFSVLTAIDPELGESFGRRFGALGVSKQFYDMALDGDYVDHILGAYQSSNVDTMFKRAHNTGNLEECINNVVDDIVFKANTQISYGKRVDTNHWEFECNTPDMEKNVDNMIAVLSEKLGEPSEDTIRVFFSMDNKGGPLDVPNAFCFKVQGGDSITRYVDNFKDIQYANNAQHKLHNMSFSEYHDYVQGMNIETVSQDVMNRDLYDFLVGILSDEANKGKHIEFVGFNARSGATGQSDTLRNYIRRMNTPVHYDGVIDGSEFFHDVAYLSDAEIGAIRSALHNAYVEYEDIVQQFGDCRAIVHTDTNWTNFDYTPDKDVWKTIKANGTVLDARQSLNAINHKGQLMYDEVAQNLANTTGALNHLMIDKHALQEALSWFYGKPIQLNMREFIDTVFGEGGNIGISTVRNKYMHEFWGDIDPKLYEKIADPIQFERLFTKADEVYSACPWIKGVQEAEYGKYVDEKTLKAIDEYTQSILEQVTLNPKESSQYLALATIMEHAAGAKRLDQLMVGLKISDGLRKPGTLALNVRFKNAGLADSPLMSLYDKMFDSKLQSFAYADKNAPLLAKIDQSISRYELFGQVEDTLAHTGMDYLSMRHMQEEISGVTDLVNRRAATAINEGRNRLMAIRDRVYSGMTAVHDGDDVLKQLTDAEAIRKARESVKHMGTDNVAYNIRTISNMDDVEFLTYMVNNAKGIMVVQAPYAESWNRTIKGLNVNVIDDESFVCWLDFSKYTGGELDAIMNSGVVVRPKGGGVFGDYMTWMQDNILGASYGFSNGHRMHAEYLEGLLDTFNIPQEARFKINLHRSTFADAYDCSVIGGPDFLRKYNEFAATTVLDVAAQGLRTATEHVNAANDLIGYATSKANNMKYNMDRFKLNYKSLEQEGIRAYTLKKDKNGLLKAQVVDWKIAERAADRCWLLDEFTVQALGDQVHGLKIACAPEYMQTILHGLDRWKMSARQLNIIGWLYQGSFLPAAGMRNWRDAVPKAAYYDNSRTFMSYLADAPKRQAKYESILDDIIASGASIDDAGIAGYFKAMGSNAVMAEKEFRAMHSISALGSSTLGDVLADQIKTANRALAKELGLSQEFVDGTLKKINAHIVQLNKKGLAADTNAFYDTLSKNEKLVYEKYVHSGGYQNKLARFLTEDVPWIRWNAKEFGRVEDVVRGALRNMYLDAGFSTLKAEHLVNLSQYNYSTTGHALDWFPFVQFKLNNTRTWASDLVMTNPRAVYNRVHFARLTGYAYQEDQYNDLFNMIGYRDVMLANPDKYLNNPDEDAQAWYNQYLEYVHNFDGVNKLYGQGIPLGNNHFIKDGDAFSTMPEFLVQCMDLVFAVFSGDEDHIWDGLANVTYEPLVTALRTIKDNFSELPALMQELKGKDLKTIGALLAGKVKSASLDEVENLVSMVPFVNTLYSTIKRDWKYGVLNYKALAAMGTASVDTVREVQGSAYEYALGMLSGIVGTYKVEEQGYKDLYSWQQKNPATYVDWYAMCKKMGISNEDIDGFLDSVFGDDRPKQLMYDMSFLHDTLLYLTERGYTPDEIDELLTNRKSWLWTHGTDAMAARDVTAQAKSILDKELFNQLPNYIKYSGDYKDILDFYTQELGYDYRHARLAMINEHPYIDPEGNIRMMTDDQFKKYVQYEGWVLSKYEDQIPKGISYSDGNFSVDHSIYAIMKRDGVSFEEALKYCIDNNVWWNSNARALIPLQQSYVDKLNELNDMNFHSWWDKINRYIMYTPGMYRATSDRMKLLGLDSESMHKAMEYGIYWDAAGETFRRAGSMEGMYYDKKTGQWKQWIDYKKMWDLGWYYKNGEWHQRWSRGSGWVDYKALYAEMWEKGYYWKNGEWHKWINYSHGRRHWVNYGKRWREGYYFKDGKWHKWIDYSKRWRKGYGEYGYYKPKNQKPKSTKTKGAKKWHGTNLLLQPYARHCFAKNVYRVDLRKYRNQDALATKSSMPSTYRHITKSENRRNLYEQQYAKYGLSRMVMRSGKWRGQNTPSTTRLRRNIAQHGAMSRQVNNRTWNEYNTQASSKRAR